MSHTAAFRTGALLAGAALGANALAQPGPTSALPADPAHMQSPAVVIVRVPKPWYAPRALVVGKMKDTVPQYAGLPGLAFKAFTFEQESGDFGGMYFWRDAASAAGWFNTTWFERVRRERGVEALVRRFEAPLTVDNIPGGTAESTDSDAVVTLVQIPVPSGMTRERLLDGFAAAVPQYQRVQGLLRKHFILGTNAVRTFGGVYLWRDAASAQAWFNAGWHQHVVQTYGTAATVEWFDAPILLPSRDVVNRIDAPALLVASQ